MTKITLRPITENDCKDIWLWRNHPEVRKNFFNTEPVPWQEHKKWFASKIKDPDTKIYIGMLPKDKIGIIRFGIEKSCVKISVNLNPVFFGRGFGSRIIKIGTERFSMESKVKKPIIAEIKKGNIASRKAFTKAGYEIALETKRKVVLKNDFTEEAISS